MKKSFNRTIYLIIGIILLLSGFCLIAFSVISITGSVISSGEYSNTVESLAGIILFFTGIFFIKKSTRKGQSAIEFLMTYGWAILAAVIALGVLSYFGVFSSNSFVGGGCTALLSPPFYVNAQSITDTEIEIEITNQGGGTQRINEITVAIEGEESACTQSFENRPIQGGQFSAFSIPCPLTAEQTVKGDIEVSYTKPSSNLIQKALGSIKCEVMLSPGGGRGIGGGEGYCGDSFHDELLGEECDDGGNEGGDGCDADCFIESGYTCVTNQATRRSSCYLCGDGIVDEMQECDDGNSNNNDGCDNSCTVETGWICDSGQPSACTQVVCGDGLLQGSEKCDDGNSNNNDGCSNSCTIEPTYTCVVDEVMPTPSSRCYVTALCGNGVLNPGERCDIGPDNGKPIGPLGTVLCKSTCIAPSAPPPP